MSDVAPDQQSRLDVLNAKMGVAPDSPPAADPQSRLDVLNAKMGVTSTDAPANFDNSATVERLHQNWARARLPEKPGGPPREAKDVWEALHAGWEHGDTSLIANYEAKAGGPDLEMPSNPTRAMKMMSMAGSFAGDIAPMMVAGTMAFNRLTSMSPGVKSAGSFAAASAFAPWVRRLVMDHYTKGDIKTFGDFWDRNAGATLDALKGGAAGATGGVAGVYAGTPLGQLAGAFLSRTGASMMANAVPSVVKGMTEATAMTVMGDALDGKFPSAEEFVFAGAAVAGVHTVTGYAGGRAADALRRSYAQTGMPLDQMVQTILNDAKARGQVMGGQVPDAIADAADQQHRANGISIDRSGTLHRDGQPMKPMDAVVFGKDNPEALARMQQRFQLNATEHVHMFQDTALERAQKAFQVADEEAMHRVTEETTGDGETPAAKTEKQALYDNTENNPKWLKAHSELRNIQAATLELPKPDDVPAALTKGSDMAPNGPDWSDNRDSSAVQEARFLRQLATTGLMKSATSSSFEPRDTAPLLTPRSNMASPPADYVASILGRNTLFPKGLWPTERFIPESSGGESSQWPASRQAWEKAHFPDEVQPEVPSGAAEASRSALEKNPVPPVSNPWISKEHPEPVSPLEPADRTQPPPPKSDPELLADVRAGVPGAGEKIIENKINRDLAPVDARTWQEKAGEVWTSFRKAAFNDQLPVLAAEQTIAGKKLTESQSLVAAQWRAQAGNWDRSGVMLDSGSKNGMIDYKTGAVIPGSLTLEDVAKLAPDIERAERYSLAKRTAEKGESTIGIPMEAALQTIAELKDEYQPFHEAFVKWQNQLAQYAVDAGLFDKEKWANVQDQNEDYVGIARVFDNLEVGGPQARRAANTPIKQLTGQGGDFQILSPMRLAIKKAVLFVRMAERNGAIAQLADAADANPEGAQMLFRKLTTELSPAKTQADMVQEAAKHLLRPPAVLPGGNEAEVYFKRNGASETYAAPKELATVLNETDKQPLGFWTRVLSIPANLERSGVINMPATIFRHAVRNPTMSLFFTENSVGSLVKGVFQAIGEYSGAGSFYDKLMQSGNPLQATRAALAAGGEQTFGDRYAAGGGGDSIAENLNQNYLQQRLDALVTKGGLQQGAWNTISSFKDVVAAASHLSDSLIKQGDYNASIEAGFSPREAASRSRAVIPDMSRKGSAMRSLNAMVPFFHSEWQSVEKLVSAAADPATRPRVLAVGSTLAGIALANWYRNRNDSRVAQLADAEKDLFLHVPTDSWQPVDQRIPYAMDSAMKRPADQRKMIDGKLHTNEGEILRVPKPFAAGILFMSGIERVAEALFKDNPHAFDGYGMSLAESMLRIPMPAFARPMIEQFSERSLQTGNPMIPASVEKEAPQFQYSDYTSETAKALGKMVATVPYIGKKNFASPIIIDNWIKSYTGGVGQLLINIADRGLQAAGVAPDKVLPERTWADNIFTRAFFVRNPSFAMKPIQDFRENFREFEQIKASMRGQAAIGNLSTAQQLLQQGIVQGYGQVDMPGTEKFLGQAGDLIRKVNENPQIKPYEKRQIINGLTYMAASAADRAGKALDMARKIGAAQPAHPGVTSGGVQ